MRQEAVLALALVWLLGGPRTAAAQAPSWIFAMPFETVTDDSRIFFLSEASVVLLADNLNELSQHAVTRGEGREAFEARFLEAKGQRGRPHEGERARRPLDPSSEDALRVVDRSGQR